MNTNALNKKVVVTVIVLCILIVAGIVGGFALRACRGPTPAPSDSNNAAADITSVDNGPQSDDTSEDLTSLFGENAQILNAVNAEDSPDVLQETQVVDEFQRRGFDECVITSDYSIDGEYASTEEISPTSSEKHPTYEALYVTPTGELWNVLHYNGQVMANPVTYNANSPHNVQLILSESESVTSYVGDTNRFYEVIPPESELIVKQVNRIDAATLNALTAEEIDKL